MLSYINNLIVIASKNKENDLVTELGTLKNKYTKP